MQNELEKHSSLDLSARKACDKDQESVKDVRNESLDAGSFEAIN